MVNVVGWAVPGSDDAGKGSAVGKFLCRRRALPAELLDSDGQAPLQCIHFDLSVAKHIQVPPSVRFYLLSCTQNDTGHGGVVTRETRRETRTARAYKLHIIVVMRPGH